MAVPYIVEPLEERADFARYRLNLNIDEQKSRPFPVNGAPMTVCQLSYGNTGGSSQIRIERSLDGQNWEGMRPNVRLTQENIIRVNTSDSRFIRWRVQAAHGSDGNHADCSFYVPPGALDFATLPTGFIIPWAAPAGGSLPRGWLVCDGTAVSRTEYAELFSLLSTAWGSGDGSTTFNLPDFEGRVLAGIDSAQSRLTFSGSDAVAGTGGSESKTEGTTTSLRSPGANISHLIDTTIDVVQPTAMVYWLIKT